MSNVEVVFEGLACMDCGCAIANGDTSGIDDYDAWDSAVQKHNLTGMVYAHADIRLIVEAVDEQLQDFNCDHCGRNSGGYHATLKVMADPAMVIDY